MDWWTVIVTAIVAVGGPAAVFKILGDWLLERQKAEYSKETVEIAHQRSILLAERQNAYSMGATSHMAAVVFDKHIGFCQEYAEATSSALHAQSPEERTDEPPDGIDFPRIRQKWALWLDPEVELKLDRFERDLQKIGADGWVYDAGGAQESKETAIGRVIRVLREHLGVEELTILRRSALAAATATTRNQTAT